MQTTAWCSALTAIECCQSRCAEISGVSICVRLILVRLRHKTRWIRHETTAYSVVQSMKCAAAAQHVTTSGSLCSNGLNRRKVAVCSDLICPFRQLISAISIAYQRTQVKNGSGLETLISAAHARDRVACCHSNPVISILLLFLVDAELS